MIVRSTGWRFKEANAVTRMSALKLSDVGRDLRRDVFQHLGRRDETFLLCLLSQDRDTGLEVRWLNIGDQPHSNRERIRSSNSCNCLGGKSEVMTICLLALCSVLKVWKNSSCVWTFPLRN